MGHPQNSLPSTPTKACFSSQGGRRLNHNHYSGQPQRTGTLPGIPRVLEAWLSQYKRSRFLFSPVGCSVMLQSLTDRLFLFLWILLLPTGFLLLLTPHLLCWLMVSHAVLPFGLCSCSKLLTRSPSLPHSYPLPEKDSLIISTDPNMAAALVPQPPLTLLALVRGGGEVSAEWHAEHSKHSERNSVPFFHS